MDKIKDKPAKGSRKAANKGQRVIKLRSFEGKVFKIRADDACLMGTITDTDKFCYPTNRSKKDAFPVPTANTEALKQVIRWCQYHFQQKRRDPDLYKDKDCTSDFEDDAEIDLDRVQFSDVEEKEITEDQRKDRSPEKSTRMRLRSRSSSRERVKRFRRDVADKRRTQEGEVKPTEADATKQNDFPSRSAEKNTKDKGNNSPREGTSTDQMEAVEESQEEVESDAEEVNFDDSEFDGKPDDFDDMFFQVDNGTLYQLLVTANVLNIPSMLRAGARRLARKIRGKTTAEMLEVLKIDPNGDKAEIGSAAQSPCEN